MRTEGSAPPFRPPAITDLGVLFLYAANLGLRIRFGSLVIDLGRGRSFTVDRANEPRLKRLVIAGHGWWTFEVASWLQGIGASWLQLDLTGRILGSGPGNISPDLPALRRAQGLAAGTELGVAMGRDLLRAKLADQAEVLELLPGASAAAEIVLRRSRDLDACADANALRVVEAQAAGAFWAVIADIPVDYVTADRDIVPESWARVGRRASLVTGASRGATSPAHGLWNFAYTIAATEVEIGLRSVGLDPGISPTGLHADTANRSGATWDVLEATRGEVDRAIIAMISKRRFRRRDFAQLPDGRVRLTAPLAREMAEVILPLARAAAAPVCEGLARTLADGIAGPSSHIGTLATNLTGDARSIGRDGIRKGSRKAARDATKAVRSLVPPACRSCGTPLVDPSRSYCTACSIIVRSEVGVAASARARARLEELRAAGNDPSQSSMAKETVGQKNRAHNLVQRAWDLENDRPDPEIFQTEILPRLQRIPLSRIAGAGGFSVQHAGLVRRGTRTPHPMVWDALRRLAEGQPSSPDP
jgi:hypothetical protein